MAVLQYCFFQEEEEDASNELEGEGDQAEVPAVVNHLEGSSRVLSDSFTV